MDSSAAEPTLSFLTGGGEMGEYIRAFDWGQTRLGPAGQWPTPLRVMVKMLLTTGHPVFIFWGEDRICLYNDAYSRSLGGDKHPRILGLPGKEAWPETWNVIAPQINQVMTGGAATWQEDQLVAIYRDGRSQSVYWTYSYGPIENEASPHRVGGVLVLANETTAQVQKSQALHLDERWHALFDQAPVSMCVLNGPEHRYEFANPHYLELLGKSSVVGRTFAEVWPEIESQDFLELLDQVYQSGEPYVGSATPVRTGNTDGERLAYVDFVYQPIRDKSGTVTGVLGLGSDVTDRERAEQGMRMAKTQLEGLLAAAEIGSWVWDLSTNVVVHDDNFARLWGWEGTEPMSHEEHFARIHPDDVSKVEAAVQVALHSDQLYVREYRIVLDDGSVRWLSGRGKVQRTIGGEPATLTGLIIDIGDLKALEESLVVADRRKDEFLATLAHELRNPLAPIRNAAAILQKKGHDEKLRAWGTAIIERQMQGMARLLDDLLDVSRVTRGKLTLQLQEVSLASVVENAVEVARPALDARRHELTIMLPPHDVRLFADSLRLAQVVANLLTNAAKYTQPGGHIALGAHVTEDNVLISVRDSGSGIAPEWLEQIFDIFAQVQHSGTGSEAGLGIGLALVRGLVELHGGTVRATSAGLGHGSEFVVTLPRPSAGASTAAPVDEIASLPGPRRRVLIADDNRDGAESLAQLVTLWNHEVTGVVHDGVAAFEAAEQGRPDIALLDIGMPGLSGYEVAQRIRATPWGRAVRLIAITGWGSSEAHQRAVDSGFDGHLTKPVDLERLAAVIATHQPNQTAID